MSYSPESLKDDASELLLGLMDCLPLGVAITNTQGLILKVNPAFSSITGYPAHEVNGQSLSLINPRKTEVDNENGDEVWAQRRDGSLFPKQQLLHPVQGRKGMVTHHIALISDLTQHRKNESHIERLVYYDDLTSLPNRQMLLQQLAQLIEIGQRDEVTFAVLLIDLDRFKTFNDSLGHPVGDKILQEAAQRIETAIRRTDMVSRQGGDEFIAVLTHLNNPEDAAVVAGNILTAMAQPISVPPHLLTVTPSIGISLFPHDATTAEALLRCADTAMYHAKEEGRNNFQYYTPLLNHRAQERMTMETALRAAMIAEELSLHFQPQVDLQCGKIIGAEALLRWQTEDGNWIPPSQFIPVAEECGLIVSLGAWALEEACRQRKQWNDIGLPSFPIAVNCSALQFRQRGFKQLVLDTITAHGLGADEIELEITESILMDSPELARTLLEEFKEAGISVAMDDFGTGYSSLAYLKKFPVDRLKIDAAFIRELDQDAINRAIVQSIIALGKNLNLNLIAEGVETAQIIDLLAQYGCHAVQGYGICRPMAASALENWIAGRGKDQGRPRKK